MKKTLVLLMAMMFSGVAVGVQAATVHFSPGAVAMTIEPGKAAAINLSVNGNSNARYYEITLMVGTAVTQGNLPASWLKPAVANLFSMVGGSTTAAINLEVDVPAGTLGGRYTAVIKPQLIRASEDVSLSDISVAVEVPSQASCTGVPSLANVKVGPSNIWAPTEKDVDINVSGSVVVDTGCKVTGTYAMDSNGGPVSGNLNIDETGNFAVKIPIKVAKDAKAKQGTVYNGMLTVVDELGSKTTQEFFVQVDHDRGK